MATNPTTSTPAKGDYSKVALRVNRLRSVDQTQGSYQRIADPGKPPYRAAMRMPEWTVDRKDDATISITGVFDFIGDKEPVDDAPQSGPIITVQATFVAVYELDPGESFTDEDALAFAKLNGNLNVHPFWRAYVSDVLGRAGMAPFLIPPFNPLKKSMAKPMPKPATPPAPPTPAAKPE